MTGGVPLGPTAGTGTNTGAVVGRTGACVEAIVSDAGAADVSTAAGAGLREASGDDAVV